MPGFYGVGWLKKNCGPLRAVFQFASKILSRLVSLLARRPRFCKPRREAE